MSDRGRLPAHTQDLGLNRSSLTLVDMDRGQDHATQGEQAAQPAAPPVSPASEHRGAQEPTGTRAPTQPLGQTFNPTQQSQANSPRPESPRPIILLPTLNPQVPPQDDNNLNPAPHRGGEAPPTAQNVAWTERLDDGRGSRDSSPGYRANQPNPVYPRYPQRLADPGLTRVNSRRSGIDWIVPVEDRKELVRLP